MFHSISAYEYVREEITGLPHPETVRKWYRKFDFSPEINANISDSLKEEVSFKKDNKEL